MKHLFKKQAQSCTSEERAFSYFVARPMAKINKHLLSYHGKDNFIILLCAHNSYKIRTLSRIKPYFFDNNTHL